MDVRPKPSARMTLPGLSVTAAALFAVPAAMKVVKVAHTDPSARVQDVLTLVARDALFALAVTAALATSAWLLRGKRGAFLVPIFATVACVLTFGLAIVEHQSWAHSGTLLDWDLLAYTAAHLSDLGVILLSEMDAATWAWLVVVVLCALIPFGANWAVQRWAPQAQKSKRSAQAAIGVLVTLAVLGAFVVVTPQSRRISAFRRSAAFALLTGAVTSPWRSKSPPATAPRETSVLVKELLAKSPIKQTLPTDAPRNVLVVVFESTRADVTTVYNPSLATTPNLAKLAETGLVVETPYIDMSHTSKALVSILCGYPARWVQTIEESEPGGLNRPCLPHVLGAVGYASAFFQAATSKFENRPGLVHNMGYDRYRGPEDYDATGFYRANYLAMEDKVMVKPVLQWVDEQVGAKKPFFLTTLTATQHHDYELPKNHPQREFAPDRHENLWNRYLNTVHYADEYLGQLMDGLKARGVYDDTLIIVVGDHGEGFMEHGGKHHNDIMWEEGIRPPLVVSNPRLWRERVPVTGLRRQVDITPTVLRSLGVSYDPAWFEGKDLREATGHAVAQASCWYDNQCLTERRGTQSLIYFFDGRPTLMYDLATDPRQNHDLFESTPKAELPKLASSAKQTIAGLLKRREQINGSYTNTEVNPSWILKEEPLPEHVVYARFEDHIELLGWDGEAQVDPGSFWNVTLYYRCLKPTPPGYKFLRVLALGNGRDIRYDVPAAKDRYPLDRCRPGDIVKEEFGIYVGPDVADGTATFYFGVRKGKKRLKPARTSLPVSQGQVVLFRPRITDAHAPELKELLAKSVTTTAPVTKHPINASFGDAVTLVTAHVDTATFRKDGALEISAVWKVNRALPGDYRIFVHVDAPRGKKLRDDVYSAGGLLPISRWKAGTYVRDTYRIAYQPGWKWPENVPMEIRMGIYNGDGRLEVTATDSSMVRDDRLLLGTATLVP